MIIIHLLTMNSIFLNKCSPPLSSGGGDHHPAATAPSEEIILVNPVGTQRKHSKPTGAPLGASRILIFLRPSRVSPEPLDSECVYKGLGESGIPDLLPADRIQLRTS